MPEPQRVEVGFKIEIGNRTMEGGAPIPDVPMRPADLLPVLLAFSEAVCGSAREQIEQGGARISCRAGCGACCRQLVPIGEAEAFYLAELVEAMPPERRDAVRERFRRALEIVGEPILERLRDTSQLKDLDARRAIGLEYFARGAACPFLENESCSIHPHRPMSCREYFVVSPRENCADPRPETIARVQLPVNLSEILYCFGDGVGNDQTRWLPLVLALEWVALRRQEPQKAYPAPRMFENFITRVRRALEKST